MSYFLINTRYREWSKCIKNKGLRAKPVCGLVNDLSVMSKFVMVMIDTLEGEEPIDPSNLFCIGPAGDAWQQSPVDLLKKYNLVSIDGDGWLHFEPKPDMIVECFQLQPTDATPYLAVPTVIQGRFGKTIDGIHNLQYCDPGDWVCRNPDATSDQWIVREKLFANTYTVV